MSDSIDMRQLSPETYQALDAICDARGWFDMFGVLEPEQVAWLAVRLEFIPDTQVNFPKGKWATIQRIQELVREAAQKEFHEPQ